MNSHVSPKKIVYFDFVLIMKQTDMAKNGAVLRYYYTFKDNSDKFVFMSPYNIAFKKTVHLNLLKGTFGILYLK